MDNTSGSFAKSQGMWYRNSMHVLVRFEGAYGPDDEEVKALPEDWGENINENEAGSHK